MSGIDLGFGRVWGDRIRVRVSVGIDLGLGCVWGIDLGLG